MHNKGRELCRLPVSHDAFTVLRGSFLLFSIVAPLLIGRECYDIIEVLRTMETGGMIYDEDEKNSFPLPLYEYDDARRFFYIFQDARFLFCVPTMI